MSSLLSTIVIVLGLLLMGAILLQPGSKGGGLGGSFGGGGANSAFGAQGATPFLAKATYWIAALFLGTTLYVEYTITVSSRSVLEKGGASSITTPPLTPLTIPAAPASSAAKTNAPVTTPAPAKTSPQTSPKTSR